MREHSPFLNHGVFSPEVTQIMGDAFDCVTKGLRDTGQPDVVQEIIASLILLQTASSIRKS